MTKHKESNTGRCEVPPFGWFCTRDAGHDGPCAAIEDDGAEPGSLFQDLSSLWEKKAPALPTPPAAGKPPEVTTVETVESLTSKLWSVFNPGFEFYLESPDGRYYAAIAEVLLPLLAGTPSTKETP